MENGDAHVVRDAGGRATDDALRSLIISSQLRGTRQFMVIHHTDCGMLTFTNEHIWKKLESETGTSASSIDFMPFSDVDVTGWINDTTSGRLRAVE